jgi:hypothetical protein
MTQSRNPPTKPSIPVPWSAPASSPKRDDEIPRGDFIDVLTHKPVEPSRLQVFPVPEEFLNQVLASPPPRLRPEDTKDTVPRGLPSQRPVEPMPASATAAITSSDEPSRPSTEPGWGPTDRARAEAVYRTVPPRARRSPSFLTRWALTGRVPTSVKLTLAAIFGVLLLLLLWQNSDMFARAPDTSHEAAADPGAPVPLIEPPAVIESAAVRVAEPLPAQAPSEPTLAQAIAASAAVIPVAELPSLGNGNTATAAAVLPKPPPVHVTESAAKMKKPSESAPATTSTGAPLRSPKLTPIFEPR